MKKPSIPSVMGVQDPVARNMLSALKENVEIMTGLRSKTIQPLPESATLSDAISKINEIIERINAH